ncbi:MAG: NAD-dependent epimerase/dehydratase family protein [Chloroherpetonaceae bacterium]
MKLLMLGGTYFLGRAIVEDALKRGDTLTLFNRGKRATVFPDVETLIGDRTKDLSALEAEVARGRTWDAVIDTSGYVPRVVKKTATLLKDAVRHYTFVSSISVYAESVSQLTEQSAIATLADETTEEITGETYGALKALCEKTVESVFANQVLNVRAGLIVGEYDASGRFLYWVSRIAKGGEVAVPRDGRTQFIDVRDLAHWILNSIENNLTGAFNVTGNFTRKSVFETCKKVSNSDAIFVEISDEILEANQILPYTELPLWLPKAYSALEQVSIEKALATGLTFRPLEETIRKTFEWYQAQSPDVQQKLLGASLKPEKEKKLITALQR